MKTLTWIYTVVIGVALVLPILPKELQANARSSSQDISFTQYQSCDLVNDPSGCRAS